jgi:hypothetical protein
MATAELVPAELSPEDVALMAEQIAGFVHDPLGFVLYNYQWNEGDLRGLHGPRTWQRKVLEYIGDWMQNPATRHRVCRVKISSGHGIGKSALVAFLVSWTLSTFPDARCTITANTKGQLDTKTQPECEKWFRQALNREWFQVNVTSIKRADVEDQRTWRADFIPWSDVNPQSSAGLHNMRKRILIVCDEASEISDKVFEVMEGAFTDAETEIIFVMFGNPTRNAGYFYDETHGSRANRGLTLVIDSREVEGTNLAEINEAVELYGEDSDWVRVRYRGLPPRAGSGQYIDLERISKAQKREARCLPDDPLVAGADLAWGGEDVNVVRFRRGYDARTIPPIKVLGEFTRDPAVMLGKLVDVLNTYYDSFDGTRRKVDMLFIDSAGIAAPIFERLTAMGYGARITLVNFGADSPKSHCAYHRDYMWEETKRWLLLGAIDKDAKLEADLSTPMLVNDLKQRIKIESKDDIKKRMIRAGLKARSPDDGDALALTFAYPVLPKKQNEETKPPEPRNDQLGWMA